MAIKSLPHLIPIITLKGIPLIEEDESEIEYDLEDVVMDTCKNFNLNNSKQERQNS